MWFKQLSFYVVSLADMPPLAQLTDKLRHATFSPCLGLDWESMGFSAATSFSEDLVFVAQDSWRIVLKKEEKVLPAAVIKDVLDSKIESIEQQETRHIGKKEKKDIKDMVVDELLPRAFTRSSRTEGIFDQQYGLLLVNQSSDKRASIFLQQLREALGGLNARLPHTKQSTTTLMTSWLQNSRAEGGFELDCDCELKGTGEEASSVRISHQDLTAAEVVNHIKNGKVVTQLGLCWQDRIRFVLNQDFSLRRIQFLDVLQEEATQAGDDVESLMFSSQILMTEALGTLIQELVYHLGGWVE